MTRSPIATRQATKARATSNSRAMLAFARWTGRSALSIATTTPRPHFATAGAYRTRVSHMRLAAFRAS